MILGYGEGELGADGRLRWTTAVLPKYVADRHVAKRRLDRLVRPFLIGMGSFHLKASQNGVSEAFYGMALVADRALPAAQILHHDYLTDPGNINEKGEFRWPTGLPFLRCWLADPPIPFIDLVGIRPTFRQHHGTRVVPFEDVVAGSTAALPTIRLQEVQLDRAIPLPKELTRSLRVKEGAVKERKVRDKERNAAIKLAALAANRLRFGAYTCEECAYQPGKDPRVAAGYARSILDVHHLEPLSGGERWTATQDLAVLCPLCHRRLHVSEAAASKANAPAE